MQIGTNIKRLRREKEMTQESLAEYLGVSVSAVSQWESEKTAPDLSLIPPLCNLLGVTSDTLLGIDLEAKQKRIEEIRTKANTFSRRGYKAEAYKILAEGLREYPDSFELMEDRMDNAYYLMSKTNYSEEERKNFTDEVIRLGETILEKCVNDPSRHSAIQTLCFVYAKQGNRERAVELAKRMPHLAVSRTMLLPRIHQGDEGYYAHKRLLDDFIQFLSNNIFACNRKRDNGEPFYTSEEKAALRDKQIAFLHLMFEMDDFGFYHNHLAETHSLQAAYYAKNQDTSHVLAHLAKAAEHAVGFLAYAKEAEFVHTSLLLRGLKSDGTGFSTTESDNDAQVLLNRMNDKVYDFVRDTKEFRRIAEMLAPYAGKWEPAK